MIRNFYDAKLQVKSSHNGEGLARSVKLFKEDDFETGLNFLYYMELDPGVSIGDHTHQENEEEMYVILEGGGTMTIQGKPSEVKAGDVVLNRLGWSHGLKNTGETILKILAFEVKNAQ